MSACAAHRLISGRLAVFALASAIAIPVGAQQAQPASTQSTPPATAQSQQTDQSDDGAAAAAALPRCKPTAAADQVAGGVLGTHAALRPQEVGEEADRSHQ